MLQRRTKTISQQQLRYPIIRLTYFFAIDVAAYGRDRHVGKWNVLGYSRMHACSKLTVRTCASQKESSLYKVMACLQDVKKRTARTEASFSPLQDTVRSVCVSSLLVVPMAGENTLCKCC